MFYTATVVDNIDETRTGVIEVYVPSIMSSQKKGVKEPEKSNVSNQFNILNNDIDQSEFSNIEIEKRNTIPALPCSMTTKNHGIQLIPEIGDEVLIYFKDNNYDVAYYMYANTYQNGVQMDYGELIEDKENAENPEKYIDHKILLLTKSKHILVFNDTEESNGVYLKASGVHKMSMEKNDNFSGFIVETETGHQFFIDDTNNGIMIKSNKGHSLLIDDENDGINLKTKDDFRVTMDSSKKTIQIVTPNGIGLEFDDNNNKLRIASMDLEITNKNNFKVEAENEIELNSKSKIIADTTDFELSTKNNTKIEAKSKIEMKSAELEISIQGNIKIEANGKCDVKGQSVTVDAQQINLGNGATSALIKGPEFLQFFNSHTHTAPLGPTSPPIVPVVEQQVCSLISKTK